LLLRSFFHTFSPDFLRGPSDSSDSDSSSGDGGGVMTTTAAEATTTERQLLLVCGDSDGDGGCGSPLFVNFSGRLLYRALRFGYDFHHMLRFSGAPMKMSVCMLCASSCNCVCESLCVCLCVCVFECVCVHEGAPLALPH